MSLIQSNTTITNLPIAGQFVGKLESTGNYNAISININPTHNAYVSVRQYRNSACTANFYDTMHNEIVEAGLHKNILVPITSSYFNVVIDNANVGSDNTIVLTTLLLENSMPQNINVNNFPTSQIVDCNNSNITVSNLPVVGAPLHPMVSVSVDDWTTGLSVPIVIDTDGNTVKIDSNNNTVKLDTEHNDVKVSNLPIVNPIYHPMVPVSIDGWTFGNSMPVVIDTDGNTVRIDNSQNTVKIDKSPLQYYSNLVSLDPGAFVSVPQNVSNHELIDAFIKLANEPSMADTFKLQVSPDNGMNWFDIETFPSSGLISKLQITTSCTQVRLSGNVSTSNIIEIWITGK